MYWQKPRHPRAGMAVGAAILVAWLGALVAAFASDDAPDRHRGAAPVIRTVHQP